MGPSILIAGIGNILLQDDGLGPQAIAQLQAQYEFGEEVELLDLGTPTLDFVDYLRGRDILVLIDALAGGGEPGELLTFDKEQLQEFLPNMRLSAHQPCLRQTLHTAAAAAGVYLKEILLVGVVGNSFDVGTELGPYVSRSVPEVLELIVNFVRRHDVKVEKRAIVLAIRSWWESENPAAS
jgi:hydrogenase maturation protease